MTPKQQERIKNKIKKIKSALAADKKRWGGYYDDSQGLRYMPPELYIKLDDFSGGLRYFNWFNKNFSDDSGFPDFLFEWTVVLFKTGRIKEAEKKAFQTFCSDTHLFDKFFDRQIVPVDRCEGANIASPELATTYFNYSHKQHNLADFAEWLAKLITTEKFINLCNRFVEIHKKLENEQDFEAWQRLRKLADQLKN